MPPLSARGQNARPRSVPARLPGRGPPPPPAPAGVGRAGTAAPCPGRRGPTKPGRPAGAAGSGLCSSPRRRGPLRGRSAAAPGRGRAPPGGPCARQAGAAAAGRGSGGCVPRPRQRRGAAGGAAAGAVTHPASVAQLRMSPPAPHACAEPRRRPITAARRADRGSYTGGRSPREPRPAPPRTLRARWGRAFERRRRGGWRRRDAGAAAGAGSALPRERPPVRSPGGRAADVAPPPPPRPARSPGVRPRLRGARRAGVTGARGRPRRCRPRLGAGAGRRSARRRRERHPPGRGCEAAPVKRCRRRAFPVAPGFTERAGGRFARSRRPSPPGFPPPGR